MTACQWEKRPPLPPAHLLSDRLQLCLTMITPPLSPSGGDDYNPPPSGRFKPYVPRLGVVGRVYDSYCTAMHDMSTPPSNRA